MKSWTVSEVRTLARQAVDGRVAVVTARGNYAPSRLIEARCPRPGFFFFAINPKNSSRRHYLACAIFNPRVTVC